MQDDFSSSSGANAVGTAGGTNSLDNEPSPVGAVVSQAKDKLSEVGGQVQQKAGEVAGQVGQKATSRLDQEKEQAVQSLDSVAGAVRQMGEQLRAPEAGPLAQQAANLGETTAAQIENASNYLRQHNVQELMREVEGFARREPVLFLGGAFLLGMLGARFLKSSGESQSSSTASNAGYAPFGGGPGYSAPMALTAGGTGSSGGNGASQYERGIPGTAVTTSTSETGA